MKRQTEKKGKQAFRDEKIKKKLFRIALAVLGKPNASSTIPLYLNTICTKFLQVF